MTSSKIGISEKPKTRNSLAKTETDPWWTNDSSVFYKIMLFAYGSTIINRQESKRIRNDNSGQHGLLSHSLELARVSSCFMNWQHFSGKLPYVDNPAPGEENGDQADRSTYFTGT